ncbi:MAG TPA: Na/Pi cotransporter family protein, partial [bacterium]|nr:Na/Pi cotransporter family protein [bacterium]
TSDVLYPLRTYPPLLDVAKYAENPVIAILAAVVLTSIVRSSAATTGLIVVLSAEGIVSLKAAIPLIYGANLGTCITAAIASLGNVNKDAKRVAIAHCSFKIISVLLFIPLMGLFGRFIEAFSIWTTSATSGTVHYMRYLPHQVANAHTFFNVFTALIFLPFMRPIEKLLNVIIPEDKLPPTTKFGPKFLDPFLLDIPELALRQSKREVLRMGKYVQRMIDDIMNAFRERNGEFIDRAIASDEKIDVLENGIKEYFTELAQRKSSEILSKRRIEMFFIVDELEKIGDVITKNIMPQINQAIEANLYFSEEGWKELNNFHRMVSENFGRSMEAFRTNDLKEAEEIMVDKKRMLRLYKQLQVIHIERLGQGVKETVQTSQIHLDILGNLRGLNSLITNIAGIMLEHARSAGDTAFTTDADEIEEIDENHISRKNELKFDD